MKEWKPIETIKARGGVHAGQARFMGQKPEKPGGSVVTDITIETREEDSKALKDQYDAVLDKDAQKEIEVKNDFPELADDEEYA